MESTRSFGFNIAYVEELQNGLNQRFWAYMFHVNFMLRRVIVVAAAFWLVEYPFF